MAFPPMDPFERRLSDLKLTPNKHRFKTFLQGGAADPKKTLDEIGRRLSEVLSKQNESRALMAELWFRYILDCRTHAVEPVKRPV